MEFLHKRIREFPGKQNYKLIFMDLNMPVKSGTETTTGIIESCKIHGVPVPYIVGISGDQGEELEERCRAAGMIRLRIITLAFLALKILYSRSLITNRTNSTEAVR